MAPTQRDLEVAERLASIEQKLDDFIRLHDGGCGSVRAIKMAGTLCLLGLTSWMGYLHYRLDGLHDKFPLPMPRDGIVQLDED